jgi:hypothetical protein
MKTLTLFDSDGRQCITPTNEAKQRIEYWLRAHDLWHNCRLYSREEWTARGEDFGDDDDFHLTAEGGLQDLAGTEVETRFYEFVSSLGYHTEQGFSWSWHFMNVVKFDAHCG